ncbi:MAG TPA: hypothetical protein VGM92_06970 [Candidatus Kapabacteria bacterium]
MNTSMPAITSNGRAETEMLVRVRAEAYADGRHITRERINNHDYLSASIGMAGTATVGRGRRIARTLRAGVRGLFAPSKMEEAMERDLEKVPPCRRGHPALAFSSVGMLGLISVAAMDFFVYRKHEWIIAGSLAWLAAHHFYS